jgi:hypothetical protein
MMTILATMAIVTFIAAAIQVALGGDGSPPEIRQLEDCKHPTLIREVDGYGMCPTCLEHFFPQEVTSHHNVIQYDEETKTYKNVPVRKMEREDG